MNDTKSYLRTIKTLLITLCVIGISSCGGGGGSSPTPEKHTTVHVTTLHFSDTTTHSK